MLTHQVPFTRKDAVRSLKYFIKKSSLLRAVKVFAILVVLASYALEMSQAHSYLYPEISLYYAIIVVLLYFALGLIWKAMAFFQLKYLTEKVHPYGQYTYTFTSNKLGLDTPKTSVKFDWSVIKSFRQSKDDIFFEFAQGPFLYFPSHKISQKARTEVLELLDSKLKRKS